MDVALVGNGTVSVVAVIAVARAWARTAPFRVKFTIGSPKPRFAKPLPVTLNVAGGVARSIVLGVMPLTWAAARDAERRRGVARSIVLGVMPLTPGPGRVSATVSGALPWRL